MNTKYNPLRIVTAFIATVISAIFSLGSSKALSAETKVISEPTIEERLAQVREQIKNLERANIKESDAMLFQDNILEANRLQAAEKLQTPWDNWTDWSKKNPDPKK